MRVIFRHGLSITNIHAHIRKDTFILNQNTKDVCQGSFKDDNVAHYVFRYQNLASSSIQSDSTCLAAMLPNYQILVTSFFSALIASFPLVERQATDSTGSFAISFFYVWDQIQALNLGSNNDVAGTLNTTIRFLFSDNDIGPTAACSIVWSPAASQQPPINQNYSCDSDPGKQVTLQRYHIPADFAMELVHYLDAGDRGSANVSAGLTTGGIRQGMFSVGSGDDSREWECVLGYCTPPNDAASVEVPWSFAPGGLKVR